MASEVSAVQKMTEDLKSSGIPETQANATVRVIAESIRTFSVTPELLRKELSPINKRLDNMVTQELLRKELSPIDKRLDSLEGKIDTIGGRMFLFMISVIGVLGASLAAALAALIPLLAKL